MNVPFRALTMRHLQCFCMLVTEHNFGRAAARLSITQPALSHTIKQLEHIVGAQLLRRSTHHLELTLAGVQLLERARFLVNTFDLALHDIDNSLSEGRALIRVGAIPSASALLVNCIGAYASKSSPTPEFVMQDGLSESLVERTRSGELDLAVTAVTEAVDGLTSVPLFEDPIVLVVPRAHALSAASSTSWRSLSGEKLVVFASGNMPALGDMALSQFGAGGPEPFRVNYVETLYSLVRGGLALGLVPSLYAGLMTDPGLVKVRLVRPSIHRSISLIHQTGAMRNAQVERFIDFLKTNLPRGRLRLGRNQTSVKPRPNHVPV